ncbi:glycosyltransferase [Sphingobium sp. Z007]|uniref:glycosyltransferase n=1 Tax=Sphingobium sp. Z007 TaxID=627495 RepID=UPI001124CCDC|nr:glycosyltransferase [Sphingobium sp. Z007]
MRSIQKALYKLVVSKAAKGFDANFYLSHYEDLRGLANKRAALKHFILHGKSEGRFPNEAAYLSHVESLPGNLRENFDVAAYKFYNKDLTYKFDTDEEYFAHYIRHGHKEGRIAEFPKETGSFQPTPYEEKWRSIFSTSEFIAWCGDKLENIPSSREDALDLFCAEGIDNIWPISFEYEFDVKFSRDNQTMPAHAHKSDADLYRAWLSEGFPSGIAPNERLFLFSYLGGMPFPFHFDWRSYAQRAGMASSTTRSQALVALFNSPISRVLKNVDLMGANAAWLLDCIGRRALVQGDFNKAVTMFKQSTALAPTAEPLCLLGDAHRALGATSDALEAYTASMSLDRGPIWAFLHATSIYVDRKEFAEAFDVLRKAYPLWRQKPEFGAKLHEVVSRYFDHQSARAHAMYKEVAESDADLVKRAAIDRLLTDTLDDIRAVYIDMDDLPAPTGGDSDGYVAILANDDLRQCNHYRIEQKVLEFEQADIPVRVFSHHHVQAFMDSLMGARAVIIYRVAALPHVLRAILHANSMNLSTYYEIDDLIFDSDCYPDPYPSFEGEISPQEYAGLQFGVPLFRYAMSMCKGSIASTPPLAEKMRAVTAGDESIIIRNALDDRNIAAIEMGAKPVRSQDGRIRIFYGSGTKAHNADFNNLVGPALLDLMTRYDHVDLVIVGHLKLRPDLAAMDDRIITHAFVADVKAYWSLLASCHINLAVLEPSIVADCKSEIKWLEAAVLQIPSVVSGTETYHDVIENGVDGLIVDSDAEWLAALEKLITDTDLRMLIGAKAREKALRDYDIDIAADTIKNVFGEQNLVSLPTGRSRLRVLICNVFFAPQSYGGATRVVEDNVWTFAEQYPDLNIGIFCSNDGVAPGRFTLESERGIPVYRLSTPQEVNMDWRPFNEGNVAPFERVLDHFKPDLIHFHCVQRLTASIVETAHRRAIPYVVTLHDAWWVSDHQFLVDSDGLLRLPSSDILNDCADSANMLASIERRQRLGSLLQNSAANLSVSRPFADIYANAGIDNVRVVENGTPAIEGVARSPRPDGRVALGHVGGRSSHKGAALIEAALRRGAYANLHLTMVDGTLAPGQSIDTFWGTTPVTLVAPFAQKQVASLYSLIDVLLAPSTWPESYGLVTREALKSGLWVIASNLGAIGQDVEEDINGYVIDVTAVNGLENILSRIDADPARYRKAPPPREGAARSMADQAADLHKIYWEVSSINAGDSQHKSRQYALQ